MNKKNYSLILVALVLIATGLLTASISAVKLRTNVSSKAAENLDPIPSVSHPDIKIFNSTSGEFTLSYDPSLWVVEENYDRLAPAVKIKNARNPLPEQVEITTYSSSSLRLDSITDPKKQLVTFSDYIVTSLAKEPLSQPAISNPKPKDLYGLNGLEINAVFTLEDVQTENTYYLFVVHETAYAITIYNSQDNLHRQNAEQLLSTIEFTQNPNVQGINDLKDSTPEKIAALVQPSIVRILDRKCATLKIIKSAGPLNGKQYPFCALSTGSGFFINKGGYIASNGHVVSLTDKDLVRGGVLSGSLKEFLKDTLILYLSSTGKGLPPGGIDKAVEQAAQDPNFSLLVTKLVDEMTSKGDASLETKPEEYYIQLGKEPFDLENSTLEITQTQDIVKAELIDKDYEPWKEGDDGFHSSDVALLKVKDGEYPSLTLADSTGVKVLQQVIIVGYPGVVTDIKQLISSQSTTEATFTTGSITSIKEAAGDQKRLFQTDAAVSYGNSGGPGINSSGEAIGVATYALGIAQSGSNYNFLRDIADLKVLMEKNNIKNDTAGSVNQLWEKGLIQFWNAQYKSSLKTFTKLEKSYPAHGVVEKYKNEAKAKINAGLDKSPILDQDTVYMISIIGAAGVLIYGVKLLITTLLKGNLLSFKPKGSL